MSCSDGLADIEDCAGEKLVPSVNNHVLPKVRALTVWLHAVL